MRTVGALLSDPTLPGRIFGAYDNSFRGLAHSALVARRTRHKKDTAEVSRASRKGENNPAKKQPAQTVNNRLRDPEVFGKIYRVAKHNGYQDQEEENDNICFTAHLMNVLPLSR